MRAILMVSLVALCATLAQGQMVLVEDFEAYTVDTSIHLQGDDGGIPRWYCQYNSDFRLVDHAHSNVRDLAGNQVLEIVNRDADDGIDTVNTSMAVWMHKITGQGTIYIQWLAEGPTDLITCTNDLWAGFGNYAGEPPVPADGYQPIGGGAYSPQGSMVCLNADVPFHGYNGGWEDVGPNLTSGVWQEVWIQVDADNDRVKYWVAVDGGAPQQMMSTSGEFWAHRNNDNDSVENIEFNMGAGIGWPPPPEGFTEEIAVLVDNIAIDPTAWTLDRFPLPPTDDDEPCIPGDADCDGDVDLDDFVALKVGFGTGTTWAEGDFDKDGDVDLDDFVILKTNFGAVAP